MRKLANLKGVKALNRMEQKSINGGSGVTMTCKNGTIVSVSHGSCSDWSMRHHCRNYGGNAIICVGPIE